MALPLGDCTVTINDSNFNIAMHNGSTTTEKNVDYSVLYNSFQRKISLEPVCQSILTANKINSFETLNAAINYGDSIKDGTSAGEMNTLNVFDFVAPLTATGAKGFYLPQLKAFAHAVKDKLIQRGEITRVAFARDKKGDVSAKSRWASVDALCAFDSGLGLDAWLTIHNTFTSFGKYIDPSTSRDSKHVFPMLKKKLSISDEVFTKLGYGPYCELTSAICHIIAGEKYTYSMRVKSTQIVKNDEGQNRDLDTNKNDYFPGNNVKNKFNGDRKFVAVVMKGLGDKLQVFLAFVLKSVIPASNRSVVCVATCDEIVLLFCTLMNVPCWFTSIGVENGLKVNEVLYYNEDNNSPDSVTKRIKSEYDVVKKGYNDLITLIVRIKTQRAEVQLSGDDKLYTFRDEFYDYVLEDLTQIQNNIKTVYEDSRQDSNNTIPILNTYLLSIKSAAVNNFFRGARNNQSFSLIRTACKYNSSMYPRINDGIKKLDKRSFFDMSKDYANGQVGGGLPYLKGGAKTINMREFFDNTRLTVHIKSDDIVRDQSERELRYLNNDVFDAGEQLKKEVFSICKSFGILPELHWDVLSDVLHQLNFNDCYTHTLTHLVNNFISDYSETVELERIWSPLRTPNSDLSRKPQDSFLRRKLAVSSRGKRSRAAQKKSRISKSNGFGKFGIKRTNSASENINAAARRKSQKENRSQYFNTRRSLSPLSRGGRSTRKNKIN